MCLYSGHLQTFKNDLSQQKRKALFYRSDLPKWCGLRGMFVCGARRRSAVVHRERGGEGASEDDAWGLERRQDVLRRKGGQREKIDCHGVWRIHYPVALDNSIRDDSQGVSLRFYRMPHAVIKWAWLALAYVWVGFGFSEQTLRRSFVFYSFGII